MARVLVSYFSGSGQSTYDAICQSLINCGNDVYRFNTSGHINYTYWSGDCVLWNKKFSVDIQNFCPEVILNFSHSLPLEIVDALPKACKVCLIDGDNPQMFWNKPTLRERMDNYTYLGMQSASKGMYESFFQIKLSNKSYLYFPSATILQKEVRNIINNISFIGSAFYHNYRLDKNDEYFSNKMFDVYDKVKKKFTITADELDENFKKNILDPDDLIQKIKWQMAGQQRINHLSVLSDLGLHIYGVNEWIYTANNDIDLARCFDKTPIITFDENAQIYNSSKICVNISHPQATTAFSWRVMDIMASNACLLMEDKPDWHDLFGAYISDEVKDVIIYKDRFDMREKAKRLLADDSLRLRCVTECQNAIEQNGRWHHRFKDLEKFLSIPLLNLEDRNPKYIFVEGADSKHTISLFKKLKITQRLKNMFYLVILFVAQIPLLDLLVNKRKRQKILNRLHKH